MGLNAFFQLHIVAPWVSWESRAGGGVLFPALFFYLPEASSRFANGFIKQQIPWRSLGDCCWHWPLPGADLP